MRSCYGLIQTVWYRRKYQKKKKKTRFLKSNSFEKFLNWWSRRESSRKLVFFQNAAQNYCFKDVDFLSAMTPFLFQKRIQGSICPSVFGKIHICKFVCNLQKHCVCKKLFNSTTVSTPAAHSICVNHTWAWGTAACSIGNFLFLCFSCASFVTGSRCWPPDAERVVTDAPVLVVLCDASFVLLKVPLHGFEFVLLVVIIAVWSVPTASAAKTTFSWRVWGANGLGHIRARSTSSINDFWSWEYSVGLKKKDLLCNKNSPGLYKRFIFFLSYCL